MPKPTPWIPAKDGLGETRKSNRNTVHRQSTPQGYIEHVNRKDGSSVRPTSPTTDPQNPEEAVAIRDVYEGALLFVPDHSMQTGGGNYVQPRRADPGTVESCPCLDVA